jgi:hypothetical protein
MRPHRLFGLLGLFGLLALVSGPTSGQDAKDAPAAGQPGSYISSPFRAFIVADDRWPPKVDEKTQQKTPDPKDRTNKVHDLVTEYGLNPTVAIFVRTDPARLKTDFEAGKFGAGRLAQQVNSLLTERTYNGVYKGARLAGFVMFLTLDFREVEVDPASGAIKKLDKSTGTTKLLPGKGADGSETKQEVDKEYPDDEYRDVYATSIRDLSNAVKAQYVPFGLAGGQTKAVAQFGIKPETEVTVIIYDKLKIAKRWEFPAEGPNDEQIKEIIEATKEMVTSRFKP